ncbi:MAG: hypothetical protein GY805_17755 [Chloroflexi bacterium]|nr:hypothetical protein [Chloroflexota bacterium]
MNELQLEPAGEIYEIKLKGRLNESWADWFDGVVFTHESDGTTTLTGEIVDQAALHGLLKKVRDLGMPLISVNRVGSDQTDGADIEIKSA